MGKNPYLDLPKSAFWKTGVAQENPYAIEGIYKKKFNIPANTKIATAGSCFAQHISRHLKRNGYNVLDVELAPPELPENLHQKFGFSIYSARYGNIYTVRQLLQLAQEVAGEWTPQSFIWEKGGKYYDGLRPAVEPEGLDSAEDVLQHRHFHIARVKELFESLDLFIFTLGLTEMWVHKDSGTVYPTAPGALVGEFDENLYEFKNAQFREILKDFNQFQVVLTKIRGGKSFKVLLTVSPVPLTATASGNHVLTSTVYSKSTLRSVAGQLSTNKADIDYFPSYEIVTNPRMHSTSFSDNLRSVREETVQTVMRHFFAEHAPLIRDVSEDLKVKDVQCEEALIDAFSGGTRAHTDSILISESVGNSHLSGFKEAVEIVSSENSFFFYPVNWMIDHSFIFNEHIPRAFSSDFFREEFKKKLLFPGPASERKKLILIGLGMFGDGIVRQFGTLSTEKSPSIPIIKSESEIRGSILDAFDANLSSQRLKIERLKRLICDASFTWIASPMPSETCAFARFGEAYVDSCSQALYNHAYFKIAQKKLKNFMSDGTILLQSDHTLSESGFTKDVYRREEHAHGIHASSRYYLEIIKGNMSLLL